VAESPSSAFPALPGLAVEAVEWLPSGADSGLVRVRGRWADEAARERDLPTLVLRAGGHEHRFESLPDARISRDPVSWRGTYLVPAELVADDPQALWLLWPSGARAGLPALARGVEPPPVPAAPERPEEPPAGGQVIDRAVLAERRARRAEAAEEAQSKVAVEALKAIEVLELRSAELERRLEEATSERDALAARSGEPGREALAAALASAAALRTRSRDWQLRLRAAEVARSSDSVRLAVLETERAALRERARSLESVRSEAAGYAAQLAAATEEAATLRADLARSAAEAAEAGAAWERRTEELESALADVRSELSAARDEAAAKGAELAQARDEGDTARSRAEELTVALAESSRRLATAEARRAAAEASARVETVARATLEDQLDRERAQTDGLRAELDRVRAAAAGAQAEVDPLRAEIDRLRSAANAARAEGDSLRSELEAERQARRAAEEAVAAAKAEADRASVSFQDRIAELEGGAEAGRLERLAQEQAEAAAAAEPAGDTERVAADLDAAAAALRSREPAATNPSGPRIVSPSRQPPRGLVVGSTRRDYPRLRGAIVKLAHDDPAAAGRLLAALLPVQGTVLSEAVAYDLTIRGTGTYGVTVAGKRTYVEALERPRPRSKADFHLTGDALALAEMLAGVGHRIGRFRGRVRARGRRGRVSVLRSLQGASLSLAEAARAGAKLDPELVYRAFAYAVHPSWTRGHSFTIAQEIAGEPSETWYLTARDGAGLSVASSPPEGGPDATVAMSRAAFDRLLRGDAMPAGERPAVRGDRQAVDRMRMWTQRAQGAEPAAD
jgi:hypothetical protein